MCLAIPLKIIEIKDSDLAVGEHQGVHVEFSTQLLENPQVGKYAIVHAGTAIEMLDEKEALETLSLFEEILKHGSDEGF
jgi:hydrogenase expression/formation protein HypC